MRSNLYALLAVLLLLCAPASAAFVTVYSVPTYTPGVGGYQGGSTSFDGVNGAGWAAKYDSAGANKGGRPIRVSLDASSALLQVTELGILGTDASGVTFGVAAMDGAGNIFGAVDRYDDAGVNQGRRAVRWDDSGAPTELENLSTTPSGTASSLVAAVNTAGVYVGAAKKFDALGADKGTRAVRWDASGAITVPESLEPDSDFLGRRNAWATNINAAGIAVGYGFNDGGDVLLDRALYWDLDGAVVDLNSLIDPANGWTLSRATSISDTGWIAGVGRFDADGPGGQVAYHRMFLMQVPAAVPEPGSLALLTFAVPALVRRWPASGRGGSDSRWRA